jgi:site-specific recombinase XerC
LGFIHRFGRNRIWHPFDAAHEGHPDLQKNGNLRAVQLLLGHTKMDSTVHYLVVELEVALTISEAIEI